MKVSAGEPHRRGRRRDEPSVRDDPWFGSERGLDAASSGCGLEEVAAPPRRIGGTASGQRT